MPNINDAFPSKYLKAADLQKRQVSVVVSHAQYEKIGNDDKLVLYFQGKQKGVVLNKTNANAVASAYGDDTDDWAGKPVTLFEAMVEYQGKMSPAIRMMIPNSGARPTPAARPAPASVGGGAGADMNDEIPFAAEWR
jgi:hypothetical protein